MQVIGIKGESTNVRGNTPLPHISIVATANAAGKVLRPFVLMQGKLAKKTYVHDHWPDARLVMTESGYQDNASWLAWAKFFVEDTGGNCILIADNHSTRRNLAAIEVFVQANVTLVTMPPHTTHVTQPLDKSYFRAFKSYFRAEVAAARNRGETLSKYNFAKYAKPAWEKAELITTDPVTKEPTSNIISGFAATGICPFDPSRVITPKVTALADTLAAAAGAAPKPDAAEESDEEQDGAAAAAGAGAGAGAAAEPAPLTREERMERVRQSLTISDELMARLHTRAGPSRAVQAAVYTSETFIKAALEKAEAADAEASRKAERKADLEAKRAAKVAKEAAGPRPAIWFKKALAKVRDAAQDEDGVDELQEAAGAGAGAPPKLRLVTRYVGEGGGEVRECWSLAAKVAREMDLRADVAARRPKVTKTDDI